MSIDADKYTRYKHDRLEDRSYTGDTYAVMRYGETTLVAYTKIHPNDMPLKKKGREISGGRIKKMVAQGYHFNNDDCEVPYFDTRKALDEYLKNHEVLVHVNVEGEYCGQKSSWQDIQYEDLCQYANNLSEDILDTIFKTQSLIRVTGRPDES